MFQKASTVSKGFKWCKNGQMIQTDLKQFMIFSKKCLNNSPPLIFNDTYIDRVNSHKHLGVHLQSNLDWATQLHQTCLKANRKLYVLRSIKMLQRKTLDLMFKVTVRSVIDYTVTISFQRFYEQSHEKRDYFCSWSSNYQK